MKNQKPRANTKPRGMGLKRFIARVEKDEKVGVLFLTAVETGWLTDGNVAVKLTDKMKAEVEKAGRKIAEQARAAEITPFDIKSILLPAGRLVKSAVDAGLGDDHVPLLRLTASDGANTIVTKDRYNLVLGLYPDALVYMAKAEKDKILIQFSAKTTVGLLAVYDPDLGKETR